MSSKKRKKDIHKKKRHPNLEAVNARRKSLENLKKDDIPVIGKGQHNHNVPRLIMEFIEDELEARLTQDEQRMVINVGITAWNIGCFGDKKMMEEQIMKTLKNVGSKIEIDEGMEPLIRKLVERKATKYNEYKYFITDYNIDRTVTGKWDLSVHSFGFGNLSKMNR